MGMNPPPSPLDNRVLARRQKDLEGFIEQHQEILDRRAATYASEMAPLWERITAAIVDEITAIYNRVQDAQGVPITQDPIKPDKLRNMGRQLERLNNLLQFLLNTIGHDIHRAKLERELAYSYYESYYFHIFAMEQSAQVAVAAPILTATHVIGAVINPWLPDGATYSDRLRSNTQYLAEKMKGTVETALGSGWSVNRTAREIQQNAQEGFYNSVRLARTEMTRAASQGASHSYMQNADILDGKRWNATLDKVTAPKDAQNDGSIFPLKYDTPEHPGQAGKRIPNHPNCRCKWSPVLSALGISTKERIARDKDGKRTFTQARSYKEYARQRGLPDIDDAVRNENPKRYLRRGEGEASIPKDFWDKFGVA